MNDDLDARLARELRAILVPYDTERADAMIRAATDEPLRSGARVWTAPLAAAAAVVAVGGGITLATTGGQPTHPVPAGGGSGCVPVTASAAAAPTPTSSPVDSCGLTGAPTSTPVTPVYGQSESITAAPRTEAPTPASSIGSAVVSPTVAPPSSGGQFDIECQDGKCPAGTITFSIGTDVRPGQGGGHATFADVPDGYRFVVTHLTLHNPAGDQGEISIGDRTTVLLRLHLADFRSLGYHLTDGNTDQPITLPKGDPIVVSVNCANTATDCTPSVDVTGHLEPGR